MRRHIPVLAMAVAMLGLGLSSTAAAQPDARAPTKPLPLGTDQAARQVLAARPYLGRGDDDVRALGEALERTRELLIRVAAAPGDAQAERAALDLEKDELQTQLGTVLGRADLRDRRQADLDQVSAKCQELLGRVADVLAENGLEDRRQKAHEALAALRAAGLRERSRSAMHPTAQPLVRDSQ